MSVLYSDVKKEYSSCSLCPRKCRVDRNIETGYCREGSELHVSRAALHMWEEPCISGKHGSGTVFFSGCNMGCVFCQNRAISRGEIGKKISAERLVEIFFELKEKGANNINLVTCDMFVPTIKWAIQEAKRQRLDLPFLMNTSSYICPDVIKSMEGLIDIYLPDFKYIRDEDAVRYSNAFGYVDTAKASIDEMVRQHPVCEFYTANGEKNLLKSGVIIRHLLMPRMVIQAKMIVKYLYERYGDKVFISLMSQYTPGEGLLDFPEINRTVTKEEYDSLIDYAAYIGVTNGYMQEGDVAKESFIPSFDCEGV